MQQAEFVTGGDDRTVRIWDIATKKMTKMVELDTACRATSYSPAGDKVAIGLGAERLKGGAVPKKTGAVMVLDEKDLSIIFEVLQTFPYQSASFAFVNQL